MEKRNFCGTIGQKKVYDLKENYQRKLDVITSRLTEKPRLLLQSCCGPCSTYVLSYLARYFEITLLYYNPNIQPQAEYDLRLEHQKKVLAAMPEVKLMECAYEGDRYVQAVKGLEKEPEGGERCTVCFRLRLEETARLAAEGKFDYFCTTLTVSPHKDAQRINAIGKELAEQYGVAWLPADFKKREGYKQSIALSKELELYRQDYCGCLYSKNT